MTNPAKLFQLAEGNPIIANCLQSWQLGHLDFESVLILINKSLANECHRIADKFSLTIDRSLIKNLDYCQQDESALDKQLQLIHDIVRNDTIYRSIINQCHQIVEHDRLNMIVRINC